MKEKNNKKIILLDDRTDALKGKRNIRNGVSCRLSLVVWISKTQKTKTLGSVCLTFNCSLH